MVGVDDDDFLRGQVYGAGDCGVVDRIHGGVIAFEFFNLFGRFAPGQEGPAAFADLFLENQYGISVPVGDYGHHVVAQLPDHVVVGAVADYFCDNGVDGFFFFFTVQMDDVCEQCAYDKPGQFPEGIEPKVRQGVLDN